jgi:hypothetical protein
VKNIWPLYGSVGRDQGGLDVVAATFDTTGRRKTYMVRRGGRMVCGIRMRDRYLAGPDGLEAWTGTGTLVTLVGSLGARALHPGLLDPHDLFPDARGVELARMTFGQSGGGEPIGPYF